MANEITITVKLDGRKSGQVVTIDKTFTQDLSGVGLYGAVQNIGTTDEQISLPSDLTSEGVTWIMFTNLDSANYVEFSTGTGGSFAAGVFAKLEAGQAFPLPISTSTIYAKANTAAVYVSVAAVGT